MVELDCRITPADYVRAQYLHLRPRRWLGYVGIALLLLIAGTVGLQVTILVREGGSAAPLLILLGFVAYLAAYFLGYVPWRARRLFAQQKDLQMPSRLQVTDDGIRAENELGHSLIPWDHIQWWKENHHLFLLYHADVLFQMIPKRCIAHEADSKALRALLLAHAKRAA